MCVYSMVGDYWRKTIPPQYPWVPWTEPSPGTNPPWVPHIPHDAPYVPVPLPQPTREEFDKLKHDMEEVKELLRAAKKYDEALGEPDCEQDEKIALLKKFAELVGVDLSEVI